MNLIIEHTNNIATIEYGKNRVRRVRSYDWKSNFKRSYLKAERHHKEILDTIPVSVCMTSRFDDEIILNENGELLQELEKDPEELFGSMKHHNNHIGITLVVNIKTLLCANKQVSECKKDARSFRLWIGFEPDLRLESRNDDFNMPAFLGGQHYFIEDLTLQKL